MVSLLDLAKRYEDLASDREATAHRLLAVHENSAQSFMEEARLLREMAAGLQKRFLGQNDSASSNGLIPVISTSHTRDSGFS